MFAFWKKIKIRNQPNPGSARPFPLNSREEWAKALADCTSIVSNTEVLVKERSPTELDGVYETLDGRAWKARDGMPDYDSVFQGF